MWGLKEIILKRHPWQGHPTSGHRAGLPSCMILTNSKAPGSPSTFKPCLLSPARQDKRVWGQLLSPTPVFCPPPSVCHFRQLPAASKAMAQGFWSLGSQGHATTRLPPWILQGLRTGESSGASPGSPAAVHLDIRSTCAAGAFDVSSHTGVSCPALRTWALKLACKPSFQEESCLLCLRAQPGPVKALGMPRTPDK